MTRTRPRSVASRAALVPTGPEKKPLAGFYDDCAALAMPAADRDAARDAEEKRKAGRSVAVAVCGKAIRDGCGGAGCASPEHAQHVRQVLEDLRELGLAEDPLVVQRYHFGHAAGEGER